MIEYDRCPTCDRFVWRGDRHKCHPEWRVREEGDTLGWSRVFEIDAEEAAREFSKRMNEENEYYLSRREQEIVVEVRPADDEDEIPERFVVSAEPSVEYHVRSAAPSPVAAGKGGEGKA
jgi:hypothetical protein